MTKRYNLERRYPDLLQQEDDQALYKLVNDLDAAYTRPELPHGLTWATTKARATSILRLQQENMFMLDYPKALRSAGVAILLCLLLFLGWIIFVRTYIVLYQGGYYSEAGEVFLHNLSILLSLIIAVGSLIWTFFRGKPHIAYAGLHTFCWVGFFCWVQLYLVEFSNTDRGSMLFAGPLALSLLLCLFLQPILTGLSKLQRLFGILVVETLPSGVPKQATEDRLLEASFPYEYEDGYKTVQPEAISADDEWSIPTLPSKAVAEEGEQHFPYHNRDLEQHQSHE
jgi:hypothetical protein